MNKVYPNVDGAVADIPDGASIAIAGFFTAGTPVPLIQALARRKVKNLTIICQQMGPGNSAVDELVLNKQVKKAICNYPFYRSVKMGVQSPFEQAVRVGEIELEVYPMGTFIEKLRAGGAGIAGFYTPTGVGTIVETGKEKRRFGNREYLLEVALKPSHAFVYAYKGDSMGNLVCRKTARNYNPEMASAASITIAAVENLVEPGELEPDMIHIPGIYVQRIVKVNRPSYIPGI
ncbi:MAG: CoA transferase subunit A [Dehalococcoidales bacterium]|nr:CoA transferase subunit A [Dehalococcoidales bacterium]